MLASVLGLLVAFGAVHAQQSEKTLTFLRNGTTPGTQPTGTSNFAVPPPVTMPKQELPPALRPTYAAPRTAMASYVTSQPAQPTGDDDGTLELPGPSRLFKRIAEKEVFDEIRIQARRRPGTFRAIFPEDVVISKERYAGRTWGPMIETVEPNYVGHGRLIFEQPNFERAGWDFGIFQPVVSLGVFYGDMITMPYQLFTRPLQRYDASAGKILPGDPTPLLLYPPELSVTGAVAEAGAIGASYMIFPR